ncbi:MAG TPA: response regulator [Ktedonobacterales bacterium]|jgi:CheY-like chemotaxis protein|nr:response regulator [Ktedonobacterales bacterium]
MARVLIVEDDPAIRQMLSVALELEGYEVSALCDGAEVIHTLREAEGRVVTLLDLMMPRVTGWEVCEQLSAEPELAARHAIVIMSAAIERGERFPNFVRAALLKPFTLSTALSLVEALSLEPVTEAAALAERAGELASHP